MQNIVKIINNQATTTSLDVAKGTHNEHRTVLQLIKNHKKRFLKFGSRLVLMMNRLTQIRQLPCCQCQAPPPSQAAHANWGEFGKGMGIKADDEYTIPLCAKCHRELDTYVWQTKEQAKAWFMGRLGFVNKVLGANHETAF